jgi:hypothetical protein
MLLLNLIPLIDVTFSTPTPHITHQPLSQTGFVSLTCRKGRPEQLRIRAPRPGAPPPRPMQNPSAHQLRGSAVYFLYAVCSLYSAEYRMRQRLNLLLCSAVLALGRMSSPYLANAANSWHLPESPAVVTEDLRFTNGDAQVVGTLYLPESGNHLPAVVVLYDASIPSRQAALYRHLSEGLPAMGIAVSLLSLCRVGRTVPNRLVLGRLRPMNESAQRSQLLLSRGLDRCTRHLRHSKPSVISAVHGNSSKLIAGHAHRPALVDLVLPLHHFASRLRNICRKRKKQILGDTLLNSNSG